jgi:hypothetical protein
MNALGARLFVDVETYGTAASHRTGTQEDRDTIDWFAQLGATDGATVCIEPWEFPMWSATWSATLDGQQVDALPVFYETVGDFTTSTVRPLATEHPAGFLTVKNRRAARTVPTLDQATLQVPGCFVGREQEIVAEIFGAHISEGSSANVLHTYDCLPKDVQVLIATPLSGWFHCASERGTGIAIARWLARQLADRGHRVGFLGTSGHELFNIGLEYYLKHHR